MDIYETAVLNYITSNNHRFVNPQFSIEWDAEKGRGGSLPDFVVLDFAEQTIYIVEVTKAYDISTLLSRVAQREERWIAPIRASLDACFSAWKYHVTLFLRDERVAYALDKTKDDREAVSVLSLKNVDCFLGSGGFEGENRLSNS